GYVLLSLVSLLPAIQYVNSIAYGDSSDTEDISLPEPAIVKVAGMEGSERNTLRRRQVKSVELPISVPCSNVGSAVSDCRCGADRVVCGGEIQSVRPVVASSANTLPTCALSML